MWGNRNSHSLLVGMQNGAATLRDSLAESYKTKYTLTMCNPGIVPLGIYPKELKILSTQKPALFIIVKTRCPLEGEWINYGLSRQWNSIQIEGNELSSHEKTWKNLKYI